MPNLPSHYRGVMKLAMLMVLGMMSTSVLAQVADPHGQLVSSVVDLFGSQSKEPGAWLTRIQKAAGELFWSLVLISVVWNFGALLLRRADFGEFFFELISLIFFSGIFYWFLTNAFNGESSDGSFGLVNIIIDSFKQMAPDGVGDLRKSADNIVQIGLNIYYQVLKQSGSQNWSDGDLLFVGITVLLIVIALTMVVAQIALILIMAWMLAYGGIFLLGFGGARWTSLIVLSYLKHVVAVGIALLSLALLVNFGRGILDQLSSGLTGGDAVQYEQLADMLVVSLIMMVLTYKVPSLLYSLVTSSPLGLLAGTASMAGNAVATGSRAIYNTAYNTAAQAISHYRSSDVPNPRENGSTSIRAQHVTVIDALREAGGIQAGMEAVYKPVDVSGQGGPRTGEGSSVDKKEGSAFGGSTPQTAWPGERPVQASPLAQAAASSGQSNEGGKGSVDAIGNSASAAIGTTVSGTAALSHEQVGGALGQGGSVFGSVPVPSLTSSGGGGMGVGGPVGATVGGGGFQPPVLNANVSASPSNGLSSPNLLGGSGASGSVGGAVSKATAGLQDGPSLGAAPRQPSRKIDDTTGPVGRRDKQQERVLKDQERTAKHEAERRKDDKEKTRENTRPVPATDNKPSAPTDDEINAFRDRRPNADAAQGGAED